jgi:hypothetical protein
MLVSFMPDLQPGYNLIQVPPSFRGAREREPGISRKSRLTNLGIPDPVLRTGPE